MKSRLRQPAMADLASSGDANEIHADRDGDDDAVATDGARSYGWALLYCAGASVCAVVLRPWLAEANLVLIYLLAVVLASVHCGRGPGAFASFLAVLCFDLFLVVPYLSLRVADPQYLLTFAIMLVVSLIVSQLTARLRHQAAVARHREQRAVALFHLSQDLSGALSAEQVTELALTHLTATFGAQALLLLADGDGVLDTAPLARLHNHPAAASAATAVYQRASNGDASDGITMAGQLHLVPLRAPMRTRGVLVLQMAQAKAASSEGQVRMLRTFAAQVALAIERVHYVDVARATEVEVTSERLRNSLLSAVSHDIRTPLTAIVGLAGTLASRAGQAAPDLHDLALAIQGDALRMNGLVTNLLDMARLQAGSVHLLREWQPLEEVVGSALASFGSALDEVQVEIAIDTAALLRFDAVLIERVLYNLVDNALKYAPGTGWLRIGACTRADDVCISVEDNGPGVSGSGNIFEKFVRGEREATTRGVGLGLAICRAIVEAHGGRIWAENRDTGGARFAFTLPLGEPPACDDMDSPLVSGAAA